MPPVTQITERRTAVDDIFDHLHDEITSLRLKPGDKISEAEIASQFGVSRQPVRDAFSRLDNLNLLLIRPQRATEVKRFSSREIVKSRFIRAAVEAEVLRRAAQNCSPADGLLLDACIEQQEAAIAKQDYAAFGKLDYAFHELLCKLADVEFAFEVILAEKAKCDRLCQLGLEKEARMPQLVGDHRDLAEAIKAHDGEQAVAIGMVHLSRLDSTIEYIQRNNANYFEPEDT